MKALIPNWIQFISTSFTTPYLSSSPVPQTTFRFHNNVRIWCFLEPKPEWSSNTVSAIAEWKSVIGRKCFGHNAEFVLGGGRQSFLELFFSLRLCVLFCSVHHRHRLGDLEFLILVMRSSGAQLQRVSSSPLQKSKATVATTLQLSLSWVVDGEGGLWTVESAEDRGVRRV